MQLMKQKFLAFYDLIAKHTEESGKQINLFAIVMMINFPMFGLVWKTSDYVAFEEFIFRATATCLCMVLATNRFWPTQIFKWLPILWYLTLLFTLPIFFSYMTLLHNASTLWLMNCVSALFFLFLVVRVMDALIILTLGVSLSFFTYFYLLGHTVTYNPGQISWVGLAATFVAAVIIGALFARDREMLNDSRISGMRLFAGGLAHDLRTSLASIHMQTELQEIILSKLDQPEVQQHLKQSLKKIVRGIEMSNQLISMQLNNIQHTKIDTNNFTFLPIKALLTKTLDEYPIRQDQNELINLDLTHDFTAWAEEIAFKNLIWNLLKNCLDCIDESGKGKVSIWLTPGDDRDDYNYLNIKDTAKGIYPKHAEKIFENFYTDRKGGTGVGLAYCKLFMRAAGGDIYCKSKYKEYAHFILKFPKID